MLTEIQKMWQIFAVSKDSVLELRALWPKGIGENRSPVFSHFIAANYESKSKLKDAFETAALDLNRQGFNVYIVMNPIRSDFTGPGCARDTDIIFRDLLLIDIDRLGDTSQPANQEELDEAEALAIVVELAMGERGWPAPILMTQYSMVGMLSRLIIGAFKNVLMQQKKVLRKHPLPKLSIPRTLIMRKNDTEDHCSNELLGLSRTGMSMALGTP